MVPGSSSDGLRINQDPELMLEYVFGGVRGTWRRRRDLNPRDPFGSNGFQDRRFQPLTHSSVSNSSALCEFAAEAGALPSEKAKTSPLPAATANERTHTATIRIQ